MKSQEYEKIFWLAKGRGSTGRPVKVIKHLEVDDGIVGVTQDKGMSAKAVILPYDRAVPWGRGRVWFVREGEMIAWTWKDGTPHGADGAPLNIVGGAVSMEDARSAGVVDDNGRPVHGITPRLVAAYLETKKVQEYLAGDSVKVLEVLLVVACVLSGAALANGVYQDDQISKLRTDAAIARWEAYQTHQLMLQLQNDLALKGIVPTPPITPGPVQPTTIIIPPGSSTTINGP